MEKYFVKIKELIKKNKENHFFFFLLILKIKDRPFRGWGDFICMYTYSWYLSMRIFGFSFFPKVCFTKNIFKVIVKKNSKAIIISNVKIAILFEGFFYGNGSSTLSFGDGSQVVIDNTFLIGDGVKIIVEEEARLYIGGKDKNDLSGITCNTIIICSKEISIGKGTIISWGCYITDSSNHKINGCVKKSPVTIEEHVWISEGVTISAGSRIGSGSVIGSKSYLNSIYPQQSLIVGCPAQVKKKYITWNR
ncbi:acyltransferase [Pectobacterium odoriferum]|uniref:acyltransferase n=1 Tax=Pectobacterium odoriferum TaxID=78398 RepID=UPI000CD1D687|nr:hypothetical protein [Pectobacterium odoriferum]POD92960.1 hypothetical protein BV925_09255 [Pectobacterium odoriferum]